VKSTDNLPHRPEEVTDLDMAFGARAMDLLPPYREIPEDFRLNRGSARPWIEFQQTWFFRGLPADTRFVPTEGVDARSAIRHLKAIQGSWEPKHEHKEAGVAYLASLWFAEVPA